jgi:polyisoprenoid-binding protein YceI
MRNLAFSFRNSVLSIVAGALLAGAPAVVAEQNLPLDPKGSSLTFVGDSFLHDFHGEARDFSGSAILDPAATPPIQKATLHFKTASLTTFNKGRDQKMRDWLKIDAHPEATFSLDGVKLVEGDVEHASAAHPAKFQVSGELRLNGTKQPISGSALGWREKDRLVVTGETVVDTLKYGLQQIREAFMTVGTNVKTSYRFSFILPAEYVAK